MSSEQELLKQKLQMWRDAKKNKAGVNSRPGGVKDVATKKPMKAKESTTTRSKFGAHPPITANLSKPMVQMQKAQPRVAVKHDAVSKQRNVLSTQNQRKEQFGNNVLKSQLGGNIPKTLAPTKRTGLINAKGARRLSRNFTAANKASSASTKGRQQSGVPGVATNPQSFNDRLKVWKKKKDQGKQQAKGGAGIKTAEVKTKVVHENKSQPRSFIASSKKLKTMIQSYASSDKKPGANSNKTPVLNKTPNISRRAKRPLNFSTNEASAKRARHLSISKSVTKLADTPGLTPKNPRVASRTPRRTPRNALEDEQHVMRGKLEAWLKARGKTPERHRHTSCHHGGEAWRNPGQLASPGLDECQLARQKTVLDHEDIEREVKKHVGACMEKYREGVPAEEVLSELEKLVGEIPNGQTVSSYWLCKAQLMENLGNDGQTVEVFDAAMKAGAEPKMDILKALHHFTSRILQFDKERDKDDGGERKSQTEKKKSRRSVRIMEAPLSMPRRKSRVQLEVDEENIINSSAVKFSVSSCTPLMKNLCLNDEDSPKCYVVTPVRRSTRKSFTELPKMLQDHDEVLDDLDELSDHKKNKMLYSENMNLFGKLDFDDEDDELCLDEEDKEN